MRSLGNEFIHLHEFLFVYLFIPLTQCLTMYPKVAWNTRSSYIALRVLELQVCTTMPGYKCFYFTLLFDMGFSSLKLYVHSYFFSKHFEGSIALSFIFVAFNEDSIFNLITCRRSIISSCLILNFLFYLGNSAIFFKFAT
jgi:hypothetical protein